MTVSAKAHLVTGATGFVGSAIVLELLANSPAMVILRGARHAGRGAIAPGSVLAAGHLYRRREIVADVERRCVALRGDLTEPECGVNARFAEPIGSVWRAAASLSFSARARDETLRRNVVAQS